MNTLGNILTRGIITRRFPLGFAVLLLSFMVGGTVALLPAGTAEAKSPERIDPEQVLSAEGVRAYNSLTPDVKSIIRNETVPQLLAEVRAGPLRGVTGELYDAEVRALVEFVVATARKAQDALERAIANHTHETHEGIEIQPLTGHFTHCDYTTSMGSSSLVVYVGHVARCNAIMAKMQAGVLLKGPGYSSGWQDYGYFNTMSALAFTSHGYDANTCWMGWGHGAAKPVDYGPNPSPANGGQSLRLCV